MYVYKIRILALPPLYSSKVGELVASFPGHVGGARKWPENEATAVKLVNL